MPISDDAKSINKTEITLYINNYKTLYDIVKDQLICAGIKLIILAFRNQRDLEMKHSYFSYFTII